MPLNTKMHKTASEKTIQWSGSVPKEAFNILACSGGAIVTPTKVGYVIAVTDKEGLDRKFSAKQRKSNKPGVVLCSSMEQLETLADMTPEIKDFYQDHWDSDILLGCILPWQKAAKIKFVPNNGTANLMMDHRDTSCFVIKYGLPSEQLVKALWDSNLNLVFASSANPSGEGNRGKLKNVGGRIEEEVDLLIEADSYVLAIQPNASEDSRHEQGVMVSMVDDFGKLVPMQNKNRGISPCPTVIRNGLDINRIMKRLSRHFPSWDYRQGLYY
jgi:tRNA A37 threonylcarbamoyladenosine synthetase subunit TsaC/SUA5/YrdC